MLATILMSYLIIGMACKETSSRTKAAKPVTVASYLTDSLRFKTENILPVDRLFKNRLVNDRYINLAIADNSFILANKIVCRNNRIYILENRNAIVSIYDSSGQLLKVLAGGSDFNRIADMDVDKNEKIYIMDGKNESVVCYDSSFVLKYKKSLKYETDILYPLKNGSFLLSLSSWNSLQNKQDKLVLVDSNYNHLKSYLTYNEYVDHNYWIKRYRFLNAGDKIYYNRPIDNKVYVLSESGNIIKSYYFDFGKMNVPDEDKKDVEANLSKYAGYRMITDFAFANEDYALGKIWNNKENTFFFLDRKNNELFLENTKKSTVLKYIGDFDGSTLTTIIYPGEYSEKDYGYLPQSQKEWLQKGGYVICKLSVQ